MSQIKEFQKTLSKAIAIPQEWLEENPTYNLIKEKYQALTPFKQRLIKFITTIILIGVILFLPISYFISSVKHELEFKEKKSLALKLLRLHANPTPPFPQVSQLNMRKRISDIIVKYQRQNYVIKNQIVPQNKKLKLKQISFSIQVDHLNIKHVTQLGAELKQLPFVKMHSLEIEESTQYKNYYDVNYVISFFSLPTAISKPKKTEPVKKLFKDKK